MAFLRQWQTTPGAPRAKSGLAITVVIVAPLVVLSILISVLFIKPCARGRAGRIGSFFGSLAAALIDRRAWA
jgi:hypothetical protein